MMRRFFWRATLLLSVLIFVVLGLYPWETHWGPRWNYGAWVSTSAPPSSIATGWNGLLEERRIQKNAQPPTYTVKVNPISLAFTAFTSLAGAVATVLLLSQWYDEQRLLRSYGIAGAACIVAALLAAALEDAEYMSRLGEALAVASGWTALALVIVTLRLLFYRSKPSHQQRGFEVIPADKSDE